MAAARRSCAAAQRLAKAVRAGSLDPEDINEDSFHRHLFTADIPDPDLVIRTSGEKRISNFLLWQSAYAEYVFMDKLWPDFAGEDLKSAIAEFGGRKRRYGASRLSVPAASPIFRSASCRRPCCCRWWLPRSCSERRVHVVGRPVCRA